MNREFQWGYCPDGYELFGPLSGYNFEPVGGGWELSPKSDSFVEYDLDQEASDIHRILAETELTELGLRQFVGKYGALSNYGDKDAICDLQELRKMSNGVRNTLALWEKNDDPAMFFEFEKLERKAEFRLRLGQAPSGGLEYNFDPNDLASYIVYQLAREISDGLEWKVCEASSCGRRFATSEGLGAISKRYTKTKRKRFCSSACRQAAHRERKLKV
jgi:hypothetical protein